MLRTIAAHSLAFLLAASSIQAATVRGTVVGWDNPALAGARVTLANADTSVVLETRSAADGTYRFEAVPGGSWRVGASRLSYDYQEVLLVVGAAEIVQDFSLGAGVHPGRWTTIGNTDPENLYATNSASLLPDGRIFYCHDTLEPVLFNPINGAKSFPTSSPSQQGCHISTLLPDGRLVFIGGQDSGDFRDAVRTVKSFDATTGTWQVLPDLIEERWYPGLARLADGRLLVMGGGQRPNAQRTATCEIYDPRTNAWTATASMSNPSDYPPALLLQTGKVLRSWWPPQLFDPSLNQWTNTGGMVQPNRFWPGHCDHTLVRLADGRACAIGIYRGSLVSPSMIELYDPGSGAWSLGANADVTRSQPEVALLPTGQVFVAGGKLEDSNPAVSTNTYGQTRLTDLYDPTTNTWRRCADMAWFRVHVQQLDIEHQSGIRRNRSARAPLAVTHLGRNHQGALASYLHARHTFIPALDHPSPAKREGEGSPAHRAVELLAALLRRAWLVQPAGVIDLDRFAGNRLLALADDGVGFNKAIGGKNRSGQDGNHEYHEKREYTQMIHDAFRSKWTWRFESLHSAEDSSQW